MARHFGRVRRLGQEQCCLRSAVANLTCRKCGNLLCIPRLGVCTKVSVSGLCWRCLCGFKVRLAPNASGRDRSSTQEKQDTHRKICRGGGVEQLKRVQCNKCLQLFGPVRPMRLVAVSAVGKIECFSLLPTVQGANGCVWISHRLMW